MVSISDIHVPYHDETVVDSAIRLIRRLKPHNVVINGDVADFFQLSRFNTGTERVDDLQDEIDTANEIRRRIRKAAPDSRIIETQGNHDFRVHSYVEQNARALKSLRALEPNRLFLYDELGFDWFPGAGFRIRPHFLVKHGTVVRGDAGASAKGEHLLSGISGISGHTHRLATYRKEGYVRRQWTEQGCLCKMSPAYITGKPNWTHGIVVCQFSTTSDAFTVEEVQARDGRLVYGGKSY